MQRGYGGFTLMELMIVVAIVAILAAIAYPSYMEYVVRTNRSAAQSCLQDVASRQQEYRLNARTFADTLTTLGFTPPREVSDNYDVTFASASDVAFVASAAPKAGTMQAARDTKCATLTLDQAGVKGVSGTGNAEECWRGR